MTNLEGFELDDHMTEEARNFVIGALKVMRPGDAIHLDVNLSRKAREDNAIKSNESLKFENLTLTEFTVKNPEDNFDVPVSCYKPKNVKEDAPITVFFHGGGQEIYELKSIEILLFFKNLILLSFFFKVGP